MFFYSCSHHAWLLIVCLFLYVLFRVLCVLCVTRAQYKEDVERVAEKVAYSEAFVSNLKTQYELQLKEKEDQLIRLTNERQREKVRTPHTRHEKRREKSGNGGEQQGRNRRVAILFASLQLGGTDALHSVRICLTCRLIACFLLCCRWVLLPWRVS